MAVRYTIGGVKCYGLGSVGLLQQLCMDRRRLHPTSTGLRLAQAHNTHLLFCTARDGAVIVSTVDSVRSMRCVTSGVTPFTPMMSDQPPPSAPGVGGRREWGTQHDAWIWYCPLYRKTKVVLSVCRPWGGSWGGIGQEGI